MLFTARPSFAQTAVPLDEVRQAGLRVVEITTVDGEEPEGKVIVKPGTEDNMNITNANKVACQIVISQGLDTLYDSGPYIKDSLGATIRITGNTSAYFSHPLNMPYKLKLEKKADLLLRGDDNLYKDKNWRLLKDATSLNTITGLKLSQFIGMEWTPAYVPCNVIINGDYRGCYLLIESVKRNPSCRINCDKQTGYIVERDPYWWKEDQWFSSSWYDGNNMYRWTWKYPEEESLTEQQQQYIQQFICAAEQSLADGSYEDYFDLYSLARWLLAHDILGTRDSGGANMFFKKHDDSDTTLLELPCLWDFDSSYDITPGTFSRLHTSSNAYFSTLLKSENRAFANTYVKLWNKKKKQLIDSLTAFLDNYPASDEGKALDISRKLNKQRWATNSKTVDEDKQLTLNWLKNHIEPLDQQIQLIDISDSGVASAKSSTGKVVTACHSLHGIRLSVPPRHGIVIVSHEDGTHRKMSMSVSKQ